jgi:hypothetical protein
MNGMNSGNNPEVVKTSLDEVLMTEFDTKPTPDQIDATNPTFFKQKGSEKQAEIYAEYMPPKEFESYAEEEEVRDDTVRTGNKTTKEMVPYKNDLPIPVEFFNDDQHGMVTEMSQQFGRKARNSRDKFAFIQSYGDAFSGAVTPNGQPMISNTQTTLSGDTVDNLETGTLTPSNMDTFVSSLELQKDQRGELGGHSMVGLLVPRALYKTAVETMESTLEANTGENQLNIFNTKYGTMAINNSPRLDATYNTLNSNANTSYFGVSRNHRITRFVREGLNTTLNDWTLDKKDRYIYKARFREVIAPQTWEGVIGSNGTV